MGKYKYGALPPKIDRRTLRLGAYLGVALAPPPPAYSVLNAVYAKLSTGGIASTGGSRPAPTPTELFPMDGNDEVSDCTIAAMAHAVTVYRGLIGQMRIMPEGDVVDLYSQLSGDNGGGLAALDVLKYWRKNEVGGDEILAFAEVDPANHDHVKQAIQLFGGVYIGFLVQQNCDTDFEARKTWTPGLATGDGHAVYVVEYDADTVTVLTWGNTQKGTWAWWDDCIQEAYAILPPEASDPLFAPGFDIAQLQSDLQEVSA